MTEPVEPPDNSAQQHDAVLLQESQAQCAVSLKQQQRMTAHGLLNHPGTRDISIEWSRSLAAAALQLSQKAAAVALKTSEAAHAKTLDATQTTSTIKLTEKDQVISWLAGSYVLDIKSDDA
jgi:hypothetical protein